MKRFTKRKPKRPIEQAYNHVKKTQGKNEAVEWVKNVYYGII